MRRLESEAKVALTLEVVGTRNEPRRGCVTKLFYSGIKKPAFGPVFLSSRS